MIALVRQHLDRADPGEVVGCYLYGSATTGAVGPESDVDLLLLTRRPLASHERQALTELLLSLSGWSGHAGRFPEAARRRPVELTSIVLEGRQPWAPPARRDLQYGEWLREDLIGGRLLEPEEDPDVPILLATALASHQALRGPQLEDLIDPVPGSVLREAMLDLIPGILEGLATGEGEERHMLLVLARILVTMETGRIVPKNEAAGLVAARIPESHASSLEHAGAVHAGEEREDWTGLTSGVLAAAEHMISLIRSAARSHARA